MRAATWLPVLAAALPVSAAEPDATQTVTVTGNPLRRADPNLPVQSLGGEALAQRRAATLGETLDGLAGVAGSGFGPNASRPVVRGLDGDRIRVLDNGAGVVDASNLSFDHAVALDPLVVERVEVLRGPAALLYGGNATGGVVNAIDNRIPRLGEPALGGRAELRLGGAAGERTGAAVLEGTHTRWAWHVDAFGRDAGDQRTPRFVPKAEGQPLPEAGRVRNSAARSGGGAVGASVALAGGRLGLSLDALDQRYGVTVEPDVTIRLARQRTALAGEWPLPGPFEELSVQAGDTRYRHDEVEGSGRIGTRFESRGRDLRLELRQRERAGWRGMWGAQAETLRFAALGDEAFVPSTGTRGQALFTLQEVDLGPWRLSAGARAEQVRVSSEGDAPGAAAHFGAAQSRRFGPRSLQAGAGWTISPEFSLQATLGRTERAPAYYELYADGVHVATAAFERGDPSLPLERSRHAELGLRWARGAHELKAQLYSTRFADFLALDATGADVPVTDDQGRVSGVPEYRFHAVRARLSGWELEARTHGVAAGWAWTLAATVDRVRGVNLDRDEPLARLAPLRAGLRLQAAQGGWRVGAVWHGQAAQRDVPGTDGPTPGAGWLDLWALWSQPLGTARLTWTLKLDNAGDQRVFSPTAVATVRGLAPRAGRALTGSVRVDF